MNKLSSLVLAFIAFVASSVHAQTLTIKPIPAVEISFLGQPGKSYDIQSNLALNSTNWTTIVSVLADGNGMCRYTNFPTGNTSFYRSVEVVNVGPGSATIALDGSSPPAENVAASNPAIGESLQVPGMEVDINPTVDSHLRSATMLITNYGGCTVSAAYLYYGSVLIGSTPVSNGVAKFSIPNGTAGTSISMGITAPYTVKYDVTGLTNYPAVVIVSVSSVELFDDQNNTAITIMGSVTGFPQYIYPSGPEFGVSGNSSITKTDITAGGASVKTFQYTATFNISIVAIGESVNIGLPSSGFGAFGDANTSPLNAEVLMNGVSHVNTRIFASYSQPSNMVLSSDGKYFTVAENQTVIIPVTYSFLVTDPGPNTYGLEVNGFKWFTGNDTNAIVVTLVSWMKNNWITDPI